MGLAADATVFAPGTAVAAVVGGIGAGVVDGAGAAGVPIRGEAEESAGSSGPGGVIGLGGIDGVGAFGGLARGRRASGKSCCRNACDGVGGTGVVRSGVRVGCGLSCAAGFGVDFGFGAGFGGGVDATLTGSNGGGLAALRW